MIWSQKTRRFFSPLQYTPVDDEYAGSFTPDCHVLQSWFNFSTHNFIETYIIKKGDTENHIMIF